MTPGTQDQHFSIPLLECLKTNWLRLVKWNAIYSCVGQKSALFDFKHLNLNKLKLP